MMECHTHTHKHIKHTQTWNTHTVTEDQKEPTTAHIGSLNNAKSHKAIGLVNNRCIIDVSLRPPL
jgi:hypothetical protein